MARANRLVAVLRWAVPALGVALLLAAASTMLVNRGSHTSAAGRSRVGGFDQIGFAVTTASGSSSRHCALLARTTAQQDRGLMNRTDLAGYDGMIFQFPAPTTTQFYMKDTLISLSIAWFDSSGRFVSTTDMPPCGSAAVCPLYGAATPYTVALEVPLGHLGSLGIGPGATMTVGGSC